MNSGYRGHSRCGVIQVPCQNRIIRRTSLQLENARHELQAVFNPVIDLVHKHLLVFESLLHLSVTMITLKGHSKNVSGPLQKVNVIGAELPFKLAIHLKNAIGRAHSLQDHVDSPADAMLSQQVGRSEPLLVFKVIGNDWTSCLQRITRRRTRGRLRRWHCSQNLVSNPLRPAIPIGSQVGDARKAWKNEHRDRTRPPPLPAATKS